MKISKNKRVKIIIKSGKDLNFIETPFFLVNDIVRRVIQYYDCYADPLIEIDGKQYSHHVLQELGKL